MKVEFTKSLKTNNWKDIRIAVNERNDNLLTEGLSEDKINLLEKVRTRPELIVKFDEFRLLLEMAAQTKKLWKPNSTLKVYFFDGQDARTNKVLEYASIWSNHCSITFEATDIIEEAQIRIAFQAPSSWSYIGTDALGVARNLPTINFGWLTDNLPDADYKQVVLHEFGHALGLIHEHQSPAVNIDWNKRYVYWYFWQHHNWTQADVDHNIFKEFEKSTIRHSDLDVDSIMGYHIPT
ncbi:MAG: M12 family metallopeptidase, partial [Urechidicola sp.]|nr:M12 family metallopeptidase [Urechidicola sp.]